MKITVCAFRSEDSAYRRKVTGLFLSIKLCTFITSVEVKCFTLKMEATLSWQSPDFNFEGPGSKGPTPNQAVNLVVDTTALGQVYF